MPVLVDIARGRLRPGPGGGRGGRDGRARASCMPVHLYGQMADMGGLTSSPRGRGLAVVEDACQAHGAERDGVGAGHARHARRVQLLSRQEPRRDGRRRGAGDRRRGARRARARAARARPAREVRPREIGLDGAARHDPGARASRASSRSSTTGTSSGATPPRSTSTRSPASATCGCRRSRRERARLAPLRRPHRAIRTALADLPRASAASRTGRHYPEPPHLCGGVRVARLRSGAFPVAEAIARECLSLPIFPGITEAQRRARRRRGRACFDGG